MGGLKQISLLWAPGRVRRLSNNCCQLGRMQDLSHLGNLGLFLSWASSSGVSLAVDFLGTLTIMSISLAGSDSTTGSGMVSPRGIVPSKTS